MGLNEDRLFKCNSSGNVDSTIYAAIEKTDKNEYYTYFIGEDIPKLNLKKGDLVYFDKHDIDNRPKYFLVDLFVDNTMIQCTIPPINKLND